MIREDNIRIVNFLTLKLQ